jgi:hypothetical protein
MKEKDKELWFIKQRERVEKWFKPKIEYHKDVDILNIWFGGDKKTEYCIESKDIVFDICNDLIIGLEIMDFKSKFIDKNNSQENKEDVTPKESSDGQLPNNSPPDTKKEFKPPSKPKKESWKTCPKCKNKEVMRWNTEIGKQYQCPDCMYNWIEKK